MKNILITGGAGFIGSHIALKLQKSGFNVTVLDNLSKQIHGDNPEKTSPLFRSIIGKVKFIHGDVTSKEDWMQSLEGQDAVIHLAAETGTGQSMYEIYHYVNTNIGGAALLLDILTNQKNSIEKVVVAESRAIYGEGRYWSDDLQSYVFPTSREDTKMSSGFFDCTFEGNTKPLKLVSTTEDSLIHPTSVYGITKQVEGQLVHLVCGAIGKRSVSFRYQNVYGPGQSLSNPYTGILSIFSTRIKNGKGITIFEDGKESRDFVYIDDVVDATILGLLSNVTNKSYNVGTGVATNVIDVAKELMACYERTVPLTISGNYRIGDIRHNYADLSLINKDLGYEPKWSFSKGISEFCKWVDLQEIQIDKYEDSLNEMKSKSLFK